MAKYFKHAIFCLVLFSACISHEHKLETESTGKKNLKSKVAIWSADSRWSKIKKIDYYEKDSLGNRIKEIHGDKSEICDKFEYKYYKDTLIYSEVRKYCDGPIESTTLYHYDSNNRILKKEILDEKGQVTEAIRYSYKSGTKKPSSEIVTENGDTVPYSVTNYNYFANGLLKEEVQMVDGSWFGSNRYEYDEQGHLIYQEAEVDGGVGIVKYYYLYEKGILSKDSVVAPNATTEYHLYLYN